MPDGTVMHACNDGEGRGTWDVRLKAGDVELVALCDGADDVSVVLNSASPIFEPAVAPCNAGSDPVVVHIGSLEEDTAAQLSMSQHGEGDVAFFIVQKP